MVRQTLWPILAICGALVVGCGSADDQYGTKAPPVTPGATGPTPMTDKKTGAQTHNLGSKGVGKPSGSPGPGGGLPSDERK